MLIMEVIKKVYVSFQQQLQFQTLSLVLSLFLSCSVCVSVSATLPALSRPSFLLSATTLCLIYIFLASCMEPTMPTEQDFSFLQQWVGYSWLLQLWRVMCWWWVPSHSKASSSSLSVCSINWNVVSLCVWSFLSQPPSFPSPLATLCLSIIRAESMMSFAGSCSGCCSLFVGTTIHFHEWGWLEQ